MLQDSDYDEWLGLFGNRDTVRFLALEHLATTKECCDFWFEKAMARSANGTGGMNALIAKDSGKLIGQCGLLIQELAGEEIMEIGYSLLPQHCGMGYASEAAKKCKDYAFSHSYKDELYSIIHTDNFLSVKVAENNGMRIHKTLPDYKGIAVKIYRITREELLKQIAMAC